MHEPYYFEPGFETGRSKTAHKCLEIVKLEVLCSDADLKKLVRIIQHECHTGQRGDRMIFIRDVTDAMRIRLVPMANNRSGPLRRATRVRHIATELTLTEGSFMPLAVCPITCAPPPLSKEQQR